MNGKFSQMDIKIFVGYFSTQQVPIGLPRLTDGG